MNCQSHGGDTMEGTRELELRFSTIVTGRAVVEYVVGMGHDDDDDNTSKMRFTEARIRALVRNSRWLVDTCSSTVCEKYF